MTTRNALSHPSARLWTAAFLISGVLAAAFVPVPRPARAGDAPLAYAPGEMVVHFSAGTNDGQKLRALKRANAIARERVLTHRMQEKGDDGLYRVATPTPDVDAAIQAVQEDPMVDYAEPNWIYTPQASVANDPYFTNGSLWGTYGPGTSPANAYGADAASAWRAGFTGSGSVCVGVIDTGIQYAHPDLAANIWTNGWDVVDGRDNDGNGYADDLHGWDFVHGDNQVYSALDGDDHGTHVAGIIGAVGNNSQGVAGVNWNVGLISGKFMTSNSARLTDAVAALDYMTDMKVRHGVNIVAVNNSWAGGGYSQSLHDAIIRAAEQNILFVAAAGNYSSSNDAAPVYPACYDTRIGTSTQPAAGYNSVISVAAIGSDGSLAAFSDWGTTTVHLGAPGVNIYSTVPSNTYGAMSGTSMAAPYVSGAIALYASTHPGASGNDIRNAVLSSVTPTASLNGKTATGGRLNIAALMGAATSAPAPTPSPAPVIKAITPNSMTSGSTITVTVTGSGFAVGAKLSFTGGSGNTPAGSGVTVAANGASLTAQVTTAKNGAVKKVTPWDVVVLNTSGQSGKLSRGFTVK